MYYLDASTTTSHILSEKEPNVTCFRTIKLLSMYLLSSQAVTCRMFHGTELLRVIMMFITLAFPAS